MTRSMVLALALLFGCGGGCKRDEPAPAVAVAAALRVAPVANDHPWVLACLTELSLRQPPGVDGRLEGLTTPDGRFRPDPVFAGETREALAEFLASYEQAHARPPELAPVWERVGEGWQLHFVEHAAGFVVDDASAALGPGGASVRLSFAESGREALGALTRAHMGDRIAVTIADEVVLLAVVRSEIGGGELELRPAPGEPAQALLNRLVKAN